MHYEVELLTSLPPPLCGRDIITQFIMFTLTGVLIDSCPSFSFFLAAYKYLLLLPRDGGRGRAS